MVRAGSGAAHLEQGVHEGQQAAVHLAHGLGAPRLEVSVRLPLAALLRQLGQLVRLRDDGAPAAPEPGPQGQLLPPASAGRWIRWDTGSWYGYGLVGMVHVLALQGPQGQLLRPASPARVLGAYGRARCQYAIAEYVGGRLSCNISEGALRWLPLFTLASKA